MELAEIQVSYKPAAPAVERTQVLRSDQVVEVLRKIWDDNIELHESAYLLCMDSQSKILGWKKISMGGIHGTVMDIRIIMAIALKSMAVSIIVAHNHPSGNLKPSIHDEQISRRLKEVAALHEIKLADSIILTVDSYLSFADNGLF